MFLNCRDLLDKMDKTGIYQIRNILDNKIYIGQAKNFRARCNGHLSKLRLNKHHSPYLQRAFNKYGEENFVFEILLYCEPFELTYYEQKLVDLLNPSYNVCKECVDSTKGTKRSDETKKKLSEMRRGKKVSDKVRQLLLKFATGSNHYLFGKHISDEVKLKMSLAKKGKPSHPMTEHTRNKLLESNKGSKRSDESRRKMSESASNRLPVSEETKLKIKETMKKYWEIRRAKEDG